MGDVLHELVSVLTQDIYLQLEDTRHKLYAVLWHLKNIPDQEDRETLIAFIVAIINSPTPEIFIKALIEICKEENNESA